MRGTQRSFELWSSLWSSAPFSAPPAPSRFMISLHCQADPSLSRAWSLMSTDAKAAIAAAVSIEREEADSGLSTSWRSKAALYIAGRSAIELGQIEACESAIARLRAKGADSFVDDLTSRLSRRYESEGRFVEAATWRSPFHQIMRER